MPKVLTQLGVQNSKPRRRGGMAVTTEISDGGCRGLRLCVFASGARSWVVRFRVGKRSRKLTLGPVLVLRPGETDPGNGGLTLPAARRACTEALHRLAQGHDPAAEKQAARQERQQQQQAGGETFAQIAEGFFAREVARKRDFRSARRQLRDLKRLAFDTLGSMPVKTIRRSDIVRLLDSIAVKHGPTMSDAVLSHVSKILDDHARRSDDYSSPIVRGMRQTKESERARERILSDDELRRVWSASEGAGAFGAYIRFLLLTSARRNEASRLTWRELTNGNTVWSLPPERNKNKKELVRPLSSAAQVVLSGMPPGTGNDLVFRENGRTVRSNLAAMKETFDKACGVTGWRLHDLRRTSRSLMSRAGANTDHAERCLGHLIKGTRGVYDRHEFFEEKGHVFEQLAALIANIVSPQQDAKVIQLRGE
jgi:integrase